MNDAPVAVNDAYTTAEDTPLTIAAPGVLGNDTAVDGNSLTSVLVAGPTHGTLTFNANDSFTYTPAANYNGADSFTYQANDGTANSNIATVSLTISSVNDAPVAADDTSTTAEDTPLTIAAPGVLANDTDVDVNPLTTILVSGSTHGTLTLNLRNLLKLRATYQLTVRGTGPGAITDQAGHLLDGNGVGVAGGDLIVTISQTNLVGAAPGFRPATRHVISRPTVAQRSAFTRTVTHPSRPLVLTQGRVPIASGATPGGVGLSW